MPGGIEVTFEQSPGVTRTVEVVVAPTDWDHYLGTIYGTGDPHATRLKEEVLATPDGTPYLVYDTYDWVPSETPELPEDDFAPGPGEWVLTDDEPASGGSLFDENVIARYADFSGRDCRTSRTSGHAAIRTPLQVSGRAFSTPRESCREGPQARWRHYCYPNHPKGQPRPVAARGVRARGRCGRPPCPSHGLGRAL